MAEFSMWGPAESGTRLALQDQNANVLNALAAQKTAGEIAMQPSALALQQAHARLYGAEADTKLEDLAIKRRVAAAMSQLGQGGELPTDPADLEERLGNLRLKAGDLEGGRKMLEGAPA